MIIRFPNLNLEWEYIPRVVRILDFEMTISGALLALGLLLGVLFLVVDSKRRGKDPNMYLGMAMFALVGGVIGARLFYAAFHWDLYGSNVMQLFEIRDGGVALYGALIGAVLFGVLFTQVTQQPFWDMADTLAIGALIAQIIARFGDFFNRESFGEYADHALAMQLPLGSVRTGEVTELMRENMIEINGVSYIQVSPLFLYESLACLLLLLILLSVNRIKKFPGAVFMRYLAYYGLIRFGVEWFRTDKMYYPGTKVDVNLVISEVLFAWFGLMARIRTVMTKKREQIRRETQERIYQKEEEEAASQDAVETDRERIGRERLEEADVLRKAELEEVLELIEETERERKENVAKRSEDQKEETSTGTQEAAPENEASERETSPEASEEHNAEESPESEAVQTDGVSDSQAEPESSESEQSETEVDAESSEEYDIPVNEEDEILAEIEAEEASESQE